MRKIITAICLSIAFAVSGGIALGTGGDCGSCEPPKPEPQKVTICHQTSSSTNPYVKITVSENALKAHAKHGDVKPDKYGNCPTPKPPDPCAHPDPHPDPCDCPAHKD